MAGSAEEMDPLKAVSNSTCGVCQSVHVSLSEAAHCSVQWLVPFRGRSFYEAIQPP